MMALSEDEQAVLRQIMNSGSEIRQDDLWRKLQAKAQRASQQPRAEGCYNQDALPQDEYPEANKGVR